MLVNISIWKTSLVACKTTLEKYKEQLEEYVDQIFKKMTYKPEKDHKFKGMLVTPDDSTERIKDVIKIFKKWVLMIHISGIYLNLEIYTFI